VEDTSKAVVAEFIATFALVLIGAGAVILAHQGILDLTGVALAHGLVLAIMVSITLHTSGGVVNPAIAVGLWVTGKLGTARMTAYVIAELAGAAAAGLLLRYLIPGNVFHAAFGGVTQLDPRFAIGKGIVIEAVATFFLAFAVFGTAIDDRGPLSKTSGFTIGLVIAFDIMAFGPYTGAAMNPARWFGPALAAAHWSDAAVWIVGPLAGAVLASVLYWSVFLRAKEPVTP
jgi:aquaporin TIP